MNKKDGPSLPGAILGGDAFGDLYRAGFGLKYFWKLTDPDYCLSVMRGAYEGGCRAFEIPLPVNVQLLLRLEEEVKEPLRGFANPSHLQGVVLRGRPITYYRNRILATFVKRNGFLPESAVRRIRTDLRENWYLFFGFDEDAEPLSDSEINAIRLDEDIYLQRLRELGCCRDVFVGCTETDWLFTLGREDIIVRMTEIVRSLGKTPYLDFHYASTVLPKAEAMKLDIAGYVAPVNPVWSWFDTDDVREALRSTSRPVIAFMAFADPSLKEDRRGTARALKEEYGISSVMFGTAHPGHAFETARMLSEVFGD